MYNLKKKNHDNNKTFRRKNTKNLHIKSGSLKLDLWLKAIYNFKHIQYNIVFIRKNWKKMKITS